MNTPFLDIVYARVDFDRELVFRFFTVFSLFEYALKQSGFRTTTGDAQANWDAFARSIQDVFDPNSSSELKEAVDYLLYCPPMKQVIEKGQMVFRRRDPNQNSSDTEKLAIYIRRVRNNLFHGGKFRYERPRDLELIQHAMVILESWAQLDKDIKQELENIA
jgi:hypothetical protein